MRISSTITNNLKNAASPQLNLITNDVSSTSDFKIGIAASSTTNEFIVGGTTTVDNILSMRGQGGIIIYNQPNPTLTASTITSGVPILPTDVFCNIINASEKNASNAYTNSTGVYLPSRTTIDDGTIIKILFRIATFPVGYYITVYGYGWADGSGPITERILFQNANRNSIKLTNGTFVELINHSTLNHGWVVTRHNGVTI